MSKERAAVNCRMCSRARESGDGINSWFKFKDRAMVALEEERNFILNENKGDSYSVPSYIDGALFQCYASCDGSKPVITEMVNQQYIIGSK